MKLFWEYEHLNTKNLWVLKDQNVANRLTRWPGRRSWIAVSCLLTLVKQGPILVQGSHLVKLETSWTHHFQKFRSVIDVVYKSQDSHFRLESMENGFHSEKSRGLLNVLQVGEFYTKFWKRQGI